MKVVGISACPAGLAHTPMAAKALEKAERRLVLMSRWNSRVQWGRLMLLQKKKLRLLTLY